MEEIISGRNAVYKKENLYVLCNTAKQYMQPEAYLMISLLIILG